MESCKTNKREDLVEKYYDDNLLAMFVSEKAFLPLPREQPEVHEDWITYANCQDF